MKKGYAQLIGWHLFFCLFYYPFQDLLENRTAAGIQKIIDPGNMALTFAGFAIMFTYALFPYLALRKAYDRPWYELAGWLLLGSVAAAGFRFLAEEVLAPVLIAWRNYPEGTSFITYYLDNLYYLVLHGTVGVIVYLLQTTKLRERQRQELLVENQKTELAFLRSQINPHFLFNTLNNVYSLFFQKSDKALRVIERLTVMLRYGLYEKAEKVPLRKELEHLVNFIELEKLRLDFEPEISLDLPAGEPDLEVPPLLLITFVENAFKHGDLKQPMSISLKTEDNTLSYTVTNAFGLKQKDGDGGIGLGNLRKRLQLVYGDRATLELKSEATTFRACLNLTLWATHAE
jgi:hypothetical protein